MARAEAGAQWEDVTVLAGEHRLAAGGHLIECGGNGLYAGRGDGVAGPASRARGEKVLRAWRDGPTRSRRGHLARADSAAPAGVGSPPFLHGRAFALIEAAYLGDALAGAELLRPLRSLGAELDTFATIAAPALARLHMDPEQPTPNVGDGALLADFPAGAIDSLLALAGPAVDTPLQGIEIRHLGGALGRAAERGGAQPKIDAKYAILGGGVAPTPEIGESVRAHVGALKHALASWHADYGYYNFVETPAGAEVVLASASYQRLQRIKASYDRDPMIISAHAGRPIGA
ncbi:MAG TPA: hypothetical protein VN871_11650 [Mycobacterium sp.]|nr:hypothetical protein [Mycobacterium sp.]